MSGIREVFIGSVAKRALESGFDALANLLAKHKSLLVTSSSEIEKAIEVHQANTRRWASEISFRDLAKPRSTSDVFVPLDIYLNPRRSRLEGEHLPEARLEDAVASACAPCIILGQPGAGKTTALKHVFSRFLDESDFLKDYNFIIRLQLRELNTAELIRQAEYLSRALQDILCLRFSFGDNYEGKEHEESRRAIRTRAVIDWLNQTRTILLLDGLDEITLKAKRDLVIEELRRMTPQLATATFFLTARSGEFSVHLEGVRIFEIRPLSDSQINVFADRWLGANHSASFLNQLRRSPFKDTSIRPLTLAHLCAIYERVHRIPEKPKSVYRKIVELLIEKWDEEKSVIRESQYADFEADRKAEFLGNMAFEITTKLKSSSFNREGLKRCYCEINDNFGLPGDQAEKVVDELETHTGLILKSGRDWFEFSHKSLQEFLTADYIVKLPRIPSNMIELQTLPNELAIAVSISSRPSEYLTALVSDNFGNIRTSFQFTRSFVSRLLLEDPDFELTPRVGFALLALYSQYLSALLTNSEQMTLFVLDQLGEQFEYLAQRIKQRVSLADLSRSHERISTTHTFDGEPVFIMERRRHRQDRLRASAESLLPPRIWVRGSLLYPTDSLLEESTSPGTPNFSDKP